MPWAKSVYFVGSYLDAEPDRLVEVKIGVSKAVGRPRPW